MSKLTGVFLLVATTSFFMVTILPEATAAKCFDTYSRCSSWSSTFTGWIWEGCDPYCKCTGYVYGECEKKSSPCIFGKKAWTCVCHGSKGPKQKKNCEPAIKG